VILNSLLRVKYHAFWKLTLRLIGVGRDGRGGHFQKLFHLVLPALALVPKSTHGMAVTPAPSSRKNSNGILYRLREKSENHRGATVLKYDHHLKRPTRAVLTGFDEHTNLEQPAGGRNFPKSVAGMSALRAKTNINCSAYSPDFIELSRASSARR
jgi:hypothetical protein